MTAVKPASALRWVDGRCQLAKLHPLDDWWRDELERFHSSKKMCFVARAGLRSGKSSSICRAIVADVLFGEREIGADTVAVAPVLSATRTDASDRLTTIQAVLRACGLRDDRADVDGLPGGLKGEFTTTTLPSGAPVIKLQDVRGRQVEIRVYVAATRSAVGYTACGAFADELDLWTDSELRANPAGVVVQRLLERATTMPNARYYFVSASYHLSSAHSRLIAAGDNELQHVARLGELGASRDDEARLRLAHAIASKDERLLEPADPTSPNIPAWVTSPLAPIERCYQLSNRDVSRMLGLYGGRPEETAGAKCEEFVSCMGGPRLSTWGPQDNSDDDEDEVRQW